MGVFSKNQVVLGMALFIYHAAIFADEIIKPFILASSGPGEFSAQVNATKEKLTTAGFEIAGEYSPYADTSIIIFTSDELKNAATKSERGGYGAAMRASITKVDNNIEVAYTNPVYWANSYRMENDLEAVSAKLSTALGSGTAFGTGEKQLSKKDIRDYHYTFIR